MTRFEVVEELGFVARLKLADTIFPPTPWLLNTSVETPLFGNKISHLVLTDSGPRSVPRSEGKIEEYSIITPLLTIQGRDLEKSMEYEQQLFLKRMTTIELPLVFGLVFNPEVHSDNYLRSLLGFGPSIIAVQLRQLPMSECISFIIKTRESIPRSVALYLVGGTSLGLQSLLIGLGVDILDTGTAFELAAKDRILLDGFERENILGMDLTELSEQNCDALDRDFDGILDALQGNYLFSRIAREAHASTESAIAVKIVSRMMARLDISKFPQLLENQLFFIGDESLYHPEVLAFKNRVTKRYRSRKNTKLILLIPCSARKPYRNSKSHTIIENAIGSALKHKREAVDVWSLTSPLGVVPRPVETVYPARHYDIPVTGHWSAEEIAVNGEMLVEMLDNHPGIRVIAHVSADYRGMIEYAQRKHEIGISWMDDRPRSNNALESLKSKLVEIMTTDFEVAREKKIVKLARRDIPGLIRYYHGIDASVDLMGMRVVGRPPRPIQIQRDKKHYLTWDQLRGEIRSSPEAAIQMANTSENWILMDTDKLRGSTVYAAGIEQASTSISPGDEVLLFNKDKTILLGVGTANMSGITMNQVNYGKMANIRKRCSIEVRS